MLFRSCIILLPAFLLGGGALPCLGRVSDHSPVIQEEAGQLLADLLRVATLQNYNTRLVVLSTTLLGIASGLIGTFLLLRKRSLMGDVLAHACLPGIGLMFMVLAALGGSGKYLPGLLGGAIITGVLGVGLVLLIRRTTRLKDDAAMGLVLSTMFGLGVAVLGLVQAMPSASAAGLETFIYGKTASMVRQDFFFISGAAVLAVVLSLLFFKEFLLLSFDENFASAQGWPVVWLDILMLAMVGIVTVVGLQAVGLILIIAFLITPAAAARFWTENLRRMLLLSGLIGGFSGWLGASASALLPRLPTGAVIVLVAVIIFLASLFFGTARGAVPRLREHHCLRRKIGRQHLLRAVYEILESQPAGAVPHPVNGPVHLRELLDLRSWSRGRLRRLIASARREDLVETWDGHKLRLSEEGFGEAARTTRNHRLWEVYLIQYADVAPAHVDRDADMVEHVLGPDIVRQLEEELIRRGQAVASPASPHHLATVGGKA